MAGRFVSIWFCHLATDYRVVRDPALRDKPFVLAAPEHGRMVIRAVNRSAALGGVEPGMVVADARAILPGLLVLDDNPEQTHRQLEALAVRCIRYTPLVASDPPDGLMLDASGCAHLWGGELPYLRAIAAGMNEAGYEVRVAIADTIGAAWGIARYGKAPFRVLPGGQKEALLSLPPAALRLEQEVLLRMHKLGFHTIGSFIEMPSLMLRRRFGPALCRSLNRALGIEEERLDPVHPPVVYEERLPCPDPVATAGGIKYALEKLLEILCKRLARDGKGVRKAVFKGYRVDGKIIGISIGTHNASCHVRHLFRLFELKVPTLAPGLGIELFLLQAPVVEETTPLQESLWNKAGSNNPTEVMELLDRLSERGAVIRRYLPEAHYWPERSFKTALPEEKPLMDWPTDRPRPVHLLPRPEPVEVTAPIPDYPPMLFRYQGKVYKIQKADGPERIEQEWWLEEGLHRDYYMVEDEQGARYWLFRAGHYGEQNSGWFLHGFFA